MAGETFQGPEGTALPPDIEGAVRTLERLGLCGAGIPAPELLLVLGSGLGGLVDSIEEARSVSLPWWRPCAIRVMAWSLSASR